MMVSVGFLSVGVVDEWNQSRVSLWLVACVIVVLIPPFRLSEIVVFVHRLPSSMPSSFVVVVVVLQEDANGDGFIDYDEFGGPKSPFDSEAEQQQQDRVDGEKNFFVAIDVDGNRVISRLEYESFVKVELGDELAEEEFEHEVCVCFLFWGGWVFVLRLCVSVHRVRRDVANII